MNLGKENETTEFKESTSEKREACIDVLSVLFLHLINLHKTFIAILWKFYKNCLLFCEILIKIVCYFVKNDV